MESKSNEKNSSEKEKEKENKNEFLKQKREELKKAVLEFRTGGKEDTKLVKMMKLINMVQLSSTIKILKDDNAPNNSSFIFIIDSASNLKELQNCKITHIVCCAKGIKNFFPDNFKYLNSDLLDLLDSETADIKKFFGASNKFIDDAIKNNGNVLVHCHAGVSRSSTILIAYIMKHKEMKIDKVLELIRSKREKVNPNNGFIKQLKEYEKEIFKGK